MTRYHGMLMVWLGISFVMGWYGFAGFLLCLVGLFFLIFR